MSLQELNITELSNQSIISKFGNNDNDSGNTEVQIAILTKEILVLSEHIKRHKKDFHSLRGLKMKVNARTRLLSYLKSRSVNKYEEIKKTLNIRK